MFGEFLESRININFTSEIAEVGEVIKETGDSRLVRELHYEKLKIMIDGDRLFELETNTFIDFKWKTKKVSSKFETLFGIHPSSRFIYIESIKAVFKQVDKGEVSVSCEIPVQGALSTG